MKLFYIRPKHSLYREEKGYCDRQVPTSSGVFINLNREQEAGRDGRGRVGFLVAVEVIKTGI